MEIIKHDDFYILDDGRVREFLFVDEMKALLIDTGFEDDEILKAVRSITDLEVEVVLTHGDPDHIGGLRYFKEAYLNKEDWCLVSEDFKLHDIKEGDVFKVKNHCLKAVSMPGHTYGSMAFYDDDNGLLFSGDGIQKGGPIFMFGQKRDLALYIQSLIKIRELVNKDTIIMPSHHDFPLDVKAIDHDLNDIVALKDGKLKGERHPFMPCLIYQGDYVSYLIDDHSLASINL